MPQPHISMPRGTERREILRALCAFTVDEMIELKDELKDKVQGNIHLDSETEVGRGSSSIMLQNPTIALDCVMYALNRLGRLTEEEREIYRMLKPKTHVRLLLNPLTRRGQV